MTHPEALWLLVLLVPLIFLFQWRYRTGRRDVSAVGGLWRSSLMKDIFVVKWFFSTLGFFIFLVAVTLSLLGLPGEKRRVPFQPLGRDVVFVLDVSRSMLAVDETPSRLGRASSIIRGVAEGIEGGRFGLVAFRGMGVNFFPLSEDKEGLFSLLGAVTPDILSAPGTNIADGLEAALGAFPGGSQTEQSIILFSDGEGLSGDVAPVLQKIRAQRIRLYLVGLGSEEGSQIPLADGKALEDSEGIPVITRLSLRELERIAEMGEGELFRANQVHLSTLLLQHLGEGLSSDVEGYREERTEKYRLFLVLALLGLLLYQGVRIIRWKDTF